MWDFSFAAAVGLVLRTLPFVLFRLAIYAAISAAYIFSIGIGATIGWLLGRVGGGGPGGAFLGGLLGFGVTSALLYLAREYLLYMVKAAHIAVLVQLLDGKVIPDGKGQLEYGADFVKAHFVESSVLFAVDQLIKGVIGAVANLLQGVTNYLPVPALQTLMGIVNGILRMSLTYADEVILAYLIRTHTDNPWATAQDGLILYAQNYRHILKNAAWLTLLIWLTSFVLFLFFLTPATALLAIFPKIGSVWVFVLALVMAWSIKKAIMEPIAIAALAQVYFRAIAGQTPDPEWRERLQVCSARFRELGQKAGDWIGGQVRPRSA